ncbi:MAG: hypothetical protein ABWZ25_05310 [Chitinophagaceae bacterium]
MKKVRLLAILNLVFLLTHIYCSYGLQFGWFGGKTVGEVSENYPSLFTPVGSTFSIWGLIYTSLLALCIRQIIFAFKFPREQESNQEVIRMGPWFLINNAFAVAWVFTWTAGNIMESTVLIIVQLITLIVINLRLDIHERIRSLGSKVFTQSPLSIYFGWITIATIANIAVYLLSIGWEGAGMDFTPNTWTKIMVMAAGIITVLVVFMRSNVLFGLVAAWAFWGILRNRQEEIYADLREVIWMTMIVVLIVSGIQLIANLIWRKRTKSRVVVE